MSITHCYHCNTNIDTDKNTDHEYLCKIERQIETIGSLVHEKLPVFATDIEYGDSDVIVMHQDAFAADYQDDELYLLGATIKYAGLFGKEVRIIGKNRETV